MMRFRWSLRHDQLSVVISRERSPPDVLSSKGTDKLFLRTELHRRGAISKVHSTSGEQDLELPGSESLYLLK
jgi:hypothetical protein